LGATVCTRGAPRCGSCPLASDCVAHKSDRTAELPSPRPRNTLPERQTAWLILLNEGQVLLEKRPPTGIWGSLWCFPELPMHADAQSFCARQYGEMIASHENLPPFSHAFTHFRLWVTTSVIQLEKRGVRAQEPGRVWLDISAAIRAAVPAPVRRILQSIQRKFEF
jgi:A/G-specific adenine glycosylase